MSITEYSSVREATPGFVALSEPGAGRRSDRAWIYIEIHITFLLSILLHRALFRTKRRPPRRQRHAEGNLDCGRCG